MLIGFVLMCCVGIAFLGVVLYWTDQIESIKDAVIFVLIFVFLITFVSCTAYLITGGE